MDFDYSNFTDIFTNFSFPEEIFEYEKPDLQIFSFYAKPVFIIIGWITNLVALILLCRKPLKATISSALLSVYAVSSVFFLLYIGVLWLGYEVYSNIPFSNAGCKFWIFSMHCLVALPTWFVVAATCERCLALLCGRKCQSGRIIALAPILGIVVVVGLIYVDKLWKASTTSYEDMTEERVICLDSDDPNNTWVLIQTVIALLFPLVILMILGCFLFLLFVMKRHNSAGQDNVPVERQMSLVVVLVAFFHWISVTPETIMYTMYLFSASGVAYSRTYHIYMINLLINYFFRSFLLGLSLLIGRIVSKC